MNLSLDGAWRDGVRMRVGSVWRRRGGAAEAMVFGDAEQVRKYREGGEMKGESNNERVFTRGLRFFILYFLLFNFGSILF